MPEKTENTEKSGRNPDGTFAIGNPGRPKGTISIKTRIKQMLESDPNRFEELCQYYLTKEEMRELLWKMIDGMPTQKLQGDLDSPLIIKVINYGDNNSVSIPAEEIPADIPQEPSKIQDSSVA